MRISSWGSDVCSSHLIMRDEAMHKNFGIDVINQIKIENPHLWTAEFQQQSLAMIREATELEIKYAHDTMPRGVLGLNASMFNEYMKFTANRRCEQIGIKALYPGAEHPLPWMSEVLDQHGKAPCREGVVQSL